MLKLDNITKAYHLGEEKVHALKGVSLAFRKSEFVSILGPSGCGKTTLLNIIGGLDRYTTGDLIINEKSTKEFKDRDWDLYRNHSVGFVFQSYNLIPHQTVLENVELALTLSGVSKKERRKRAEKVLKKVGLKDKLKSKPNQLSGGQMQRVAIARALVNDPEIILADEPTGALDTETSVQIMKLLKDISKDKLIVMVTHNPELAESYSTRIVKMLDGKITDDTSPYEVEVKDNVSEEIKVPEKSKKGKIAQKSKGKAKNKKTKMSFFTALALSFKNLLTKKGRTILVSFAGSIGIIGIALILAISNGFSAYVNKTQQDTLSKYPVELTTSNYNIASLMQIMMGGNNGDASHGDDKVYTNDELTDMLSKFNASSNKNDLVSFKKYIEGEGKAEIEKYTSAIQYVYNVNVNAYYDSIENGLINANLTSIFADKIAAYPLTHSLDTQDKQLRYGLLNMMFGSESSYYSNEFWSEMLDNTEMLKSQYELVGEGSKWASEYNEVMIVVDENNEISDYTLFGLGLLDQDELDQMLDNYINGLDCEPVNASFTYEDLLGLDYKIILESDYFVLQPDGKYLDIRTLKGKDNAKYAEELEKLYNTKAIEIKVAGIIRERKEASAKSIDTVVAYSSKLTRYIIEQNNLSPLMTAQLANDDENVLTGEAFVETENITKQMLKQKVLSDLGYANLDMPEGIYLYPIDFEAKGKINDFIDNYNSKCMAAGEDDKYITYSDTIGTIMSSVSTIITSITYVLIAFVGVSLVVSSIMIGIITYISVIERTKEIGVLRSVGASKKDVKRVFTAESFIIGLASGLFGITISFLLTIPINLILKHFTGLTGIASLPVLGCVILVVISVVLTLIAGLIPARVAAKKDPVVALRSN